MIISCISDTQSSPSSTVKYLGAFKNILDKSDMIVHLGDGISNAEKYLSSNQNKVFICGNHDIKNKGYIKSYNIKISNRNILFIHGERDNKILEQIDIWKNKLKYKLGGKADLSNYYRWLSSTYNQFDLVVYGHIHVPKIEKISQTYYFCPGGFADEQFSFGSEVSMGTIEIGNTPNLLQIDIWGYNRSTSKIHLSAHEDIIWQTN